MSRPDQYRQRTEDSGTNRRRFMAMVPVAGSLGRIGQFRGRSREEITQSVGAVRRSLDGLDSRLERARNEVEDVVEALQGEDSEEGQRALENVDEVNALLGPLDDEIEAVFEDAGPERERAREEAMDLADEGIELLTEIKELVSVGNETFVEETEQARAALDEVKTATEEASDVVSTTLDADLDEDEEEAVSTARNAVRFVDRNCRDADEALEDEMPEEAESLLNEADERLQTAIAAIEEL